MIIKDRGINMGTRLMLYLGILILGAYIGFKDKISEKLKSQLNNIQNICLLFLLFIMGIKIGIDENVINSFFSIGLKAFIMSIFTVGFSIIGVFLVSKFILGKRDKIESSNIAFSSFWNGNRIFLFINFSKWIN